MERQHPPVLSGRRREEERERRGRGAVDRAGGGNVAEGTREVDHGSVEARNKGEAQAPRRAPATSNCLENVMPLLPPPCTPGPVTPTAAAPAPLRLEPAVPPLTCHGPIHTYPACAVPGIAGQRASATIKIASMLLYRVRPSGERRGESVLRG